MTGFDSFGLIEFGWSGGQCLYFGAQAHRLGWLTRDGLVEPALTSRYGPFPDRVDVDELWEAVAATGFPLVEVDYHDEDWVSYWSPVSHMGVLANRSTRSVEKQLGPNRREQFHEAAVTEVGLLLDVDEPPDEAVRRWLATATRPAPGDIAAARALRNEIHQVERALPRLRNPRLADQLRQWVTEKPGLLADERAFPSFRAH